MFTMLFGGASDAEADRFMAVLILPLVFILGWGLLYELFYGGSFLNNNYGIFGGLFMVGLALCLIWAPVEITYDAYRAGILGQVFKDFFSVGWRLVLVVVFVWAVLKAINIVVRRCNSPKVSSANG